ncbi:head GIN domain-containing protein [Aquimarina sp. 2201CG5-10]|uniref:head GIN domain-containing protein n=1 Tax=Aquimarina callyspongiae TaxID=3098150 RepID=UPI002AB4D2A5|nr:head GIN domain-containing protein [Aquimarina sp. 2201CG5-10]MDY8136513.1 head GIN domain-containing protein [Aquimarina sp. 2201CG5-10]
MKKIVYIVFILIIYGCDTENALDCFQRTGDIIREEIVVSDFTRILVNPNVELILKEGETTEVIVETGDNLLNEVSAIVEGNRLILSNTNDCNFARDFNQTKIYVTAPNITEIRSATQFDIFSDGTLSYPSLKLLSEDFNEDTGTTTGTFNLQLDNESVEVVSNNIASFFLSGITENLNVGIFSGTGRFEGAELIAQNVEIFHRGTNKIIVNPQQSLRGEIRSTGDIISVNRPPTVDVTTFFTGKLLFQ